MSFTISCENCEYRGEGNAGLVIRLKKEEKVLRLIKQDNACKITRSKEVQLKELESKVEIIKNVMKFLLGQGLIQCPVIVFLSKEDIQVINCVVNKFRPDFRRHKSVKEEDSYVLMLPDYCSLPPHLKNYPSYGPVISIEIKPKQGFMLQDEFLLPGQSSVPIHMCRFCMMQQYKVKQGVISEKSGYCPTDLYSGCPIRMHHSLKMLLKTPQNNFRIFKDQKLVYSEERKPNLNDVLSDFFDSNSKISCSDLLCSLIVQVLMQPLEALDLSGPSAKNVSQMCINAYPACSKLDPCHFLPVGCVLDKILRVQTLASLCISDVYSLYLKIKSYNTHQNFDNIGCYARCEMPPHLGEPNKHADETDYQYASRKISVSDLFAKLVLDLCKKEEIRTRTFFVPQIYKLWEFLVALTMKDCSIMLVLKHLVKSFIPKQYENVISDGNGNFYLFSIAVVDLDAKPLNKVEKVYTEAPFILESCIT